MRQVRFHPEEENKSGGMQVGDAKPSSAQIKAFRKKLRKLGEGSRSVRRSSLLRCWLCVAVFVNDAFACAHRAHSSMLGEGFKQRAAGLLMKRELDYYASALQYPARPFVAILGGVTAGTIPSS